MAIDASVLRRQRMVFATPEEIAADPGRFVAGTPMSDKKCPRCRKRYLAKRNKVGVCGYCWNRLGRRARRWLVEGGPRKVQSASPETIARARAKLAARGIHIGRAA